MPRQHQPAPLTPAAVRSWLGQPRFDRYLSAVGGDEALALQLYRWNAKVAGAALVDVGHFEVALRNSYDRQLSMQFPDWTVDPSSGLFEREQGKKREQLRQREINERSRRDVAAAANGLGSSPSHGQVVAALSFGFWGQLTRPERTATFWTHMIEHCYPDMTRGRVHQLVQNVVRFRNRLAHNEPVFSTRTGLAARMRDMMTLFAVLHDDVAAWVQHESDVPALVGACPVAGVLAPRKT